jgi:hypothetical protein
MNARGCSRGAPMQTRAISLRGMSTTGVAATREQK